MPGVGRSKGALVGENIVQAISGLCFNSTAQHFTSLFNFNFCSCQYFIVYLSLKKHCLTLIKLGLLPNDTHVNCKFN